MILDLWSTIHHFYLNPFLDAEQEFIQASGWLMINNYTWYDTSQSGIIDN